jgi:hypothetical protein
MSEGTEHSARRVWLVGLVVSVAAIAALVVGWRSSNRPADAGTVPSAATREAVERPAASASAAAPPATTPGPVVGTQPARLEDLDTRSVVAPVAIRIESLGVDTAVVAAGAEPATGEMAVPPDPSVVAWYQFGPAPGEAGSAVLAGHVDYGGRPGSFFSLASLEPGASVAVTGADGREQRFVVTARRQFSKPQLPVAELFTRDGPPTLVLVTCGGGFDRAARSYLDNVVVYAVPDPG